MPAGVVAVTPGEAAIPPLWAVPPTVFCGLAIVVAPPIGGVAGALIVFADPTVFIAPLLVPAAVVPLAPVAVVPLAPAAAAPARAPGAVVAALPVEPEAVPLPAAVCASIVRLPASKPMTPDLAINFFMKKSITGWFGCQDRLCLIMPSIACVEFPALEKKLRGFWTSKTH